MFLYYVGRGNHESLQVSPFCLLVYASSIHATHLFYSAPKEETIPALTPLGDNLAQKKSNARSEAVCKAMASGLKKVRDLGEGIQG